MTKTTRPAAVLMLPAITATRAARIQAAIDRHPIDNRPATWAAKPGQPSYCPAHLMHPAQIESTAQAAAVVALQRREQSSGLPLMRQLLQTARANTAAANLPDLAADALTAERAHAHHAKQAEAYQRIADRKNTDPAEAKAARLAAREHRKQAEKHRQAAEILNRAISHTAHTDLADILTAAKVAIYATIANPAAPVDAAYLNAVKAASKAIDNSAQATTLTSTRTVWESLTPEAAKAWAKSHPGADKVYFNVRDSARAGYFTLEYWTSKGKKRKSRRPDGWYLVRHYNTVPACISYEVYTDTEAGQAAIVKNGGINAIQSQSDADELTALLTRANLSDKEREVCYKTADQTADRHAAQAEREHIEQARARAANQSKATARKTIKRAKAEAVQVGANAALENAFDRAHIYAERTRRRYVTNIRTALTAAQTPKAIQTAEEREEKERKQWERMHQSRTRATRPATIAAPDIIGAVARAAEAVTIAPAVVWLTDYPAPVALTPAEVEQMHRAAAPDSYIWHKAREHQSRTPWHNAGQAAAVFLSAMTPAEVDSISKAARAAEAAQRDRAERAARLADSARKERERATRAGKDPAAAVAVWLDRIGAAELADLLTK